VYIVELSNRKVNNKYANTVWIPGRYKNIKVSVIYKRRYIIINYLKTKSHKGTQYYDNTIIMIKNILCLYVISHSSRYSLSIPMKCIFISVLTNLYFYKFESVIFDNNY